MDKRDYRIGNINKLDPHRAFSIFLFDKNNKMLLQQRQKK